MAQLKLASKKISENLIDIIAALIIVLVFLMAYFALMKTQTINGQPTLLTVQVKDNIETIYPEAAKMGQVYFDSANKPVKIAKISKDQNNVLDIVLEGPGEVNNRFIFDGTRILIGQKAEIHGNFFAQGVITNIRYAD
jgi:hypothetical protein